MARTVPPRGEIEKQYTWNIESVFPSNEAWEREFAAIGEALPGLDRFRGALGNAPDLLLEWLHVSEDLARRTYTIWMYAQMQQDVDTADGGSQARESRAVSLFGRVATATAFAEPEILALGQETIDRFMKESEALHQYAHAFDDLFSRQAHVRSTEVEEVLGLASDPFNSAINTHRVLADADMRFQSARTSSGDAIDIAQGNIDGLLWDADREVRRTAWESYADSYLSLKNTIANTLITGVKQDVFTARVRRYDSSLEAALAPNHIPLDVFHTLIDTFRRNLPIWHRYWRIRREALGYERLHEYDVKAPIAHGQHIVPFDRSLEWVVEGMRPLGDEYVTALHRGVAEQRWVDIYPNQNKRSGAYSSGQQGTYPFILMNYDNDVESMSTLAHELGHSMHSYFAWQTQPYVYSDYSIFVAEVASNFNQALVRAYLFETIDDPDFQIKVIEEAMSNFHRYFFIMPTLARFELELHERIEREDGLNAETMIELMADLFSEGYGDEVKVDRERTGITWAQFPNHLYSNFYVYQYATGISAAHALAEGVLAEGEPARDRYLAFLRAGGSLYPIEALKLAGVDMTSPEPIERGFAAMNAMIDRLEGLLQQRKTSAAAR